MAVPLLATKLFLPPARAGRVQRERLLARLDDLSRPGVRLGLISAPAGFGKTSLLAEWLSRQPRPAAWLSLDAGDNAPELFLAYLAAAVERARPGLLPETGALLNAHPPAPFDMLLAGLVNELAALPPDPPLLVALDDFQFVTSAEVRDVVAFLVERLPPGLRLVIATRSDPPLPLPRLRARGQMVELRAADLRFTTPEAAEFLAQSLDLNLDPAARQEMAAALNERTEGWAAGLQMAGLALKTAPGGDPARLAQSFSGSHRFVLDYLGDEVLSRLPQPLERFLVQSSVLERFNAGLCAAVIEESGGAERCQAVLDELDRSNLFLIPLDAERSWFRYHHLFADLLRARLKQAAPGLDAALHRRAATWFESNGLPAEAIHHWLAAAARSAPPEAAGDYQHAAGLVERSTIALFRRGELHGLERWVSLLPRELADQRPWLCIYRAWICNFTGRLSEVEPLLQKAEARREGLSEDEQRELTGQCAAVRCQLAVVSPDQTPVFAQARIAAENLPEGTWARGVCQWAEAYMLRGLGHLERAERMFAQQVQNDRASGDTWGLAMSASDLGIVLRLRGQVREAARVCRQALDIIESLGARRFGYTGRLLTALAAALYDLDDLDQAARLLEEAVELNQRWRNPNHLVYSYLNLSRVRAAQGQLKEAADLLDLAAGVLRDMPVLASLRLSQEGLRLNLALRLGQSLPAGPAVEEQIQNALRGDYAAQPFSESRETAHMHAARLLLARKRPAEALRILEAVESAAREPERGMVLIEALSLKALALHATRSSEQARQALDEAAARAEPDGILRPIADSALLAPGAARQLLVDLRARPLQASPAFIDRLIEALPEPQPAGAPAAPQSAAAPAALVEPLSDREMEVLRLLAEGLTNVQIAARLIIASGTVKAHTASIFRKLDAANRTQAVAKAREYHIL